MRFAAPTIVAGSFVTILLCTTSLAIAASMTPIPRDPVATASGKIAGTRLVSGVKAYLGIPYAKPPVGDLRWVPPQPVSWDGVWNADRRGPECIQVLRPHNINHYFGEEPSGEDCLYMNVWTPADAKPGDNRPVIVFIYGGGGTIGSSGMANYDGENAARRGAIFVNFNYRVGLLGFMAHPELTREQGGHSGNYGYLDQNLALRWIHENIARFGGDPSKVVITGQSFGAGSVAAQITSPLSKGLFRAAMMSSACNLSSSGLMSGAGPLAEAERVGLEAQKRLGAADLAAMRSAPADKILALQAESQVGADNPGLRAPAVIDGYFWVTGKEQALAQHIASDVPIIASSNGDDLDAGMNPITRTHTVAEYQAMAEKMYGPAAPEFLKLYPVRTDADVQPMAHRAAWEGGLLQSSRTCGDLKAKYTSTATFIDLFTHKHPYAPGVRFADQNPETVGAYHTADVPYWFDTLDKYNMFRPTRVWTAYDRQLSDRMFGALVALAETGSPSTAGFNWPAYSAKNPAYVVFGDTAKVETLPTARMDWLAAHPISAAARAPQRSGPRD